MKKPFLLLSLMGIFLSTVFAAESSAQVLDQRSSTPETLSGPAISDRNAQTVTVGVEGYLARIDIQIYQSDALVLGDLVVDIFGLDLAGAPDIDNLLGSATIGNGMIPTATEFGNNFQYTPADFSSQNLHFEVGDQFAIVPRRTSLINTGTPPWIIWSGSGNNGSYSGGSPYLDRLAGWDQLDGAQSFQTFVTTEPSAPAQVMTFFNLTPYDGSEELIDFDSAGVRPFDQVHRVSSVGFNLLDEGTLNDTRQAPTGASIPNTSSAREFAPFDGSVFFNFGFDVDLELRFDNPINTASAEIRARRSSSPEQTLTFELYNGNNFISSVTVDDRGGDDFFSYGVQSTELFDRLIIRNRDDQRFSMDNLRFGTLPTTPFIVGDSNQNGVVNFEDITPFISYLFIGYQAESDMNQDGIVDLLDIRPFIVLLSSN